MCRWRASSEAGLDARLRELSQQPFDLTAELPIRATILELAPEDHVLLLRIHHFAADAHSDSIMFDELSQLYAGALAAERSSFRRSRFSTPTTPSGSSHT